MRFPPLLTNRRRPIETAHATFANAVAVERKREVIFAFCVSRYGTRFCARRLLALTNITISACRASCSFVIRSGAVKHDETPHRSSGIGAQQTPPTAPYVVLGATVNRHRRLETNLQFQNQLPLMTASCASCSSPKREHLFHVDTKGFILIQHRI